MLAQSIKRSSSYSFNSILRTLLKSGNLEKALSHFVQFKEQGFLPDNYTIPSLLRLSDDLHQPLHCRENIHSFAIKNGYFKDIFVTTGFVEMYLSFGCVDSSRQLFDETPKKDVVLWTAMVSGVSHNGLGDLSVNFFSQMLREGVKPNRITVTSVLAACSQLKVPSLGRSVHGFSIRNGIFSSDVVLETAFVDMYAKCGNLGYSTKVFDRMRDRNYVTWNAIITGHANNMFPEPTFRLFREMICGHLTEPESSILASLLQVCGGTSDLRHGREIHAYVTRSCKNMKMVENNALIDMYAKAGDLYSAVLLFENVKDKNLVTWTTMISGYGMHGLGTDALEAFDAMKKAGITPDGITFIALLSACSHGRLVNEGLQLYISMQRDYKIEPEMKHFACMIDIYARSGFLAQAFSFMKKMPVEPSEFIWASLLSSCRTYKNVVLGEQAAKKALAFNQHNTGVYVLLSQLYADSGQWQDFSKVRLVMKDLGLKPTTAQSWVEVERKLYIFTVRDSMNPCSEKMYNLLEELKEMMHREGFVAHGSFGCHDITKEEKEGDLCGHTERLALAFFLIKCGSHHGVIRIGKNLRVCKDCHVFFKFISKLKDCDIILKDPNRYHHFKQGNCNCRDLW